MSLTGQSTADILANALKEMINTGSLPEGARLVERELASQFSVSRIPMREAIRKLEQEGLVDIYRNRGAVVRTLSAKEINDIYALRALLEGDAIFQSVRDMDAETLARAELIHTLLGNTAVPEKQGPLNREFHDILYRSCHNQRHLTLINELQNQIARYEHFHRRLLSDTMKFQEQHATILHACQERNADAAREATISHLLSAGQILQDFIGTPFR